MFLSLSYADVVSTVALALTLGSLAWHVIAYHRDRGRLKLDWSIGHRVNPDGVGNKLAAAIVVKNVGRRPVYVGSLWYQAEGENFYHCQFSDEVAGKVEPTDSRQALVVATNLLRDDVRGVFVTDGVGNRSYLPESEFAKLKLDLKAEHERLAALGME